MDCVTCVLVGMCVMCGPGFGRYPGGAQSGGRPMTEAELNQALESMLQRFQTSKASPSLASYSRRQSFVPDVRFTDIGIGKRLAQPKNQQLLTISNPIFSGLGSNPGSINDKQAASFLRGVKQGLTFGKLGSEDGSIQKGKIDDNKGGEVRHGDLLKSKDLTIEAIVNSLKRNKLEELLHKKIAEGKELAVEIGEMNDKNKNMVAMETNCLLGC